MSASIDWKVDRKSYVSNFPVVSIPAMPSITGAQIRGWFTPIKWCEVFYENLSRIVSIKKALKFQENGMIKVYAFIENPSTENILNLSEIYCEFLASRQEQDEEFYFEFLVFGENEFDESQLPAHTCISRQR